MIKAEDYFKKAKLYYSFLESDFGMQSLEEKVRGNVFYEIRYGDSNKVISISYETIEDHLQVILLNRVNGELPDYDDTSNIFYLHQLTKEILPSLSSKEIVESKKWFASCQANDRFENKLLKHAQELRICLMHLAY